MEHSNEYVDHQLLTTGDAAELLNVSEATVRRLIRERTLGVVRVRRTVRVNRSEIERFVLASTLQAKS